MLSVLEVIKGYEIDQYHIFRENVNIWKTEQGLSGCLKETLACMVTFLDFQEQRKCKL